MTMFVSAPFRQLGLLKELFSHDTIEIYKFNRSDEYERKEVKNWI